MTDFLLKSDASGVPRKMNATLAGDVYTPQVVAQNIPSPLTPGLIPVDTLATLATSRVIATSGTAQSVTLTATCRRVSMFATQGTWFSLSGAASNTSHYIGAGERLDFDVPASTTISVLQETTAGSIRISELV